MNLAAVSSGDRLDYRESEATAGGLAATVLIGAIAGPYPAIRAARLAATEALATP